MEYDSGTYKARCLECGDRIEYGRQDKKFCCETCKNRYNNRRARGSRGIKVKVLSALEKNHNILERVLKLGLDNISVAELRQMGFNFDYVTSYHKVMLRHHIHSHVGQGDFHIKARDFEELGQISGCFIKFAECFLEREMIQP